MKNKIFATIAAGVMAVASFTATAADTLRVGTHPTFAPFEFLDSASREYVGFDMDMIREIGKRMNVKVLRQIFCVAILLVAANMIYNGILGKF